MYLCRYQHTCTRVLGLSLLVRHRCSPTSLQASFCYAVKLVIAVRERWLASAFVINLLCNDCWVELISNSFARHLRSFRRNVVWDLFDELWSMKRVLWCMRGKDRVTVCLWRSKCFLDLLFILCDDRNWLACFIMFRMCRLSELTSFQWLCCLC